MKLSEIKTNWEFTKNIGATSYWFEQTDDGTGKTIGPEEVLDIGCQLEAEKDEWRNRAHMAEAKVMSRDTIIEQLGETALAKDVAKAEAENEALGAAVDELLEVADHRGDNVLPHPADDPLLWSSRMQDAWDNLAELRKEPPCP